MSDYTEHRISMAGGDGEPDALDLDAIQARRESYLGGCSRHDDCLRADVAALLALVREQAANLERVEALHQPVVVYELDPENGTWIYDGDERRVLATLCGECTPEFVLGEIEDGDYDGSGSDADVQYPCPTIAALTATEGA